MTSATSQRPTADAAMTTATRPGAFRSSFNAKMGNSNEKGSQALGSTFSGAGWQPGGIWGSGTIGSFGKREAVGSRGSSTEDAFNNGPSGSSALAATSEADPWGPRPGPWGSSESPQRRNNSGSTSPNRTRDGVVHEQSSTSPYYTSSQPHAPPAIGQRGVNLGSRGKSNQALDPSTGSFKFGQPDYNDERENGMAFGAAKYDSEQSIRAFRSDKRGSQDPSYLNVGGSASRDHSKPPSSHSDTDLPVQVNPFGDFSYGGHPGHASHSQRPSISALSSSYATQGSSARSFMANQVEDGDLSDKYGRSMSLNDDGLANAQTYAGGASQPFQFNPVSQPWERGYGSSNGYAQDAYPDSPASSYMNKRAGGAERGSSVTSAYRQAIGSPRSYGGTPPQHGQEPWARPTSRDPRMALEADRRHHNQHFAQQQHQAPPFYPPTYYPSNYAAQYPPHMYEHYSAPAHPSFRPNIPLSPYGLPMTPYLTNPGGVPVRPSKDQDPAKGVRSPLLEEFRSSSKSNKRYDLKDIYNHVVEFSGDQHGSRFIQQKLETANSDEKDQIFREIEPNAIQLMKDVFGNYVIQKFFEHGNQVQKKVLAGVMKGKVVDLSVQMYACRVVQKALEHVLVEQQAELVKEIEPDVLRIVRDQNGNHVVQKIIELVPRQYIGFVMDCFRGRVSELASHSYGCRVVQRVLEHGTEADKTMIMDELHACAQLLITDQYGNYVTQHVIQHGKPEDRSKMIRVVISQLLTLSKHKFASNVVEKCIEFGTTEERRQIQQELTTLGADGNSALQLMMKDQYGNYVIQKLLSQLEGPDKDAFVEDMRPQLFHMKKSNNGRQISALDRLVSTMASPAPTKNGPTPASTAPQSPAALSLQAVDAHCTTSAAPTPGLTMEPNSPSSSPPSTEASSADDVPAIAADKSKDLVPPVEDGMTTAGVSPRVRLDEA